MAEVTRSRMLEAGITVKLLSVLLAALLWVSVMMERPGETKLSVAVRPEHVPAGLSLAEPPRQVEITVRGPKILLLMLPLRNLGCAIDLSGATGGTAEYRPGADSVLLPDRDLQVVRVSPASVPVTLVRKVSR